MIQNLFFFFFFFFRGVSSLSQPRLNIFTVGNMRVMICLGQGGLRSLSASSSCLLSSLFLVTLLISCKHTTCYSWKSFFFVPMVQILCDYIIIDTIRCQSDVICNGIVSKRNTRLLCVFDICLISYNYHN